MEKAQKRSKTVRTQFGAILVAVAAASVTLSVSATTYTSASYVQDGLITQWDGIDNAGTGTHNPNATVWKDLAGNLDLTLTANGSWTNGNALSVNGAAAYGSTKAPVYKTIEVVYSKPFQPNKSCVLFHSGYTNRFVVFRYVSTPTNQVYFEAAKTTKVIAKRTSAGEITSVVALYGDDEAVSDVLCDGERRADGTYSEGWGLRNRVSVGGRYSDMSGQSEGSPSKGEVYAIRLYSRRLTKAELAHNNRIDRKRFMTSANYTQDGLIGQWDGEDNVGTGEHDPSATVWKDLKGNLDLTLTANGRWNAAGNALVAYRASAVGDSPAPAYKTIEIAYRSTYQNPNDGHGGGHNSVLLNASNADRKQMVFFRGYGVNAYFSGIKSKDTGVKHWGVALGTFNSNAVHVLAATYTNVAAQAALTYLDGTRNTNAKEDDSWSCLSEKMIVGDNQEASYRPFYGEVYALRFYDRELTADELAADAAMDQKRIFAPRVMTWDNLSDGNFGTSGKWSVSGTGGQNIPRYSDRVFLPAGDYAATLDEDWAIGELSVGAGAALKFSLPSDATATNVVRLTVFGKVEADATSRIVLDAAAFGKVYKDGSVTLLACDVASSSALQNLAENVSFVGGRRLGRVEVSANGKSLVYTALPQGTTIYFK